MRTGMEARELKQTDKHLDTSSKDNFLTLKRALQKFQSDRLNATYSDLKQMPEYKKIGDFFFNKLYGPEDYSFRDESIKTLHKLLDGKVYKGMVSAVAQVIELHELSDHLDNKLVELMIQNGYGTDLTMEQYRKIYRQLDNDAQRVYQIQLSLQVTQAFYRLSKKWIVGVSLKTVRTAAGLLGIGKIMDFIYEGYTAFQEIENIDYFLQTIEKRELEWHRHLFEGENI